MDNATIILELNSVTHDFESSDAARVRAVQDVSLELRQGTFTCLVGPSGCGKSTLLRICAGLLQPRHGEVLVEGKPHKKPQRRISMVFQKDNLMPWRTVHQNLTLPLELAGIPKDIQKKKAKQWIQTIGLDGFENKLPPEISGGMAQRVAIARGLINDPDILLLDEPFGALDAMTREEMWQELLRIWSQTRATVLMVTHSIREAILLADNIAVMSPRPGQIIYREHVPFARPRSLDLVTTPAFNDLEANIRKHIRR